MNPLGIKAIVVVIVLTVLGGLYWRYETLVTENAQLAIANEANEKVIANMKIRAEARSLALAALQSEYAKSRHDVHMLEQKFSKHDLSKLAKAKPTMITKRMKMGTKVAIKGVQDAANTID